MSAFKSFLVLSLFLGDVASYLTYDSDNISPYGDFLARYRKLKQPQIRALSVGAEQPWPSDKSILENSGQIAGIDTDNQGNVHIFRRLDHTWTAKSFNNWKQYRQRAEGPIKGDAILVLDKNGKLLRSWGKNRFYMPHGLVVDDDLATWVTDTALHQVLKFDSGSNTPSMVMGKEFTPGRNVYSFCMPTDVALDSSGNIYVSDGYCNARILMYRRNGDFVQQWGSEDQRMLYIPHSLTMIQRRSGDVLCVADRENSRVICYQGMNNDARRARRMIRTPGKIYAIESYRNTLYGMTYDGKRSSGFSFDTLDWKFEGAWNLSLGIRAHDIAVNEYSSMFIANIDTESGKKPVYELDLDSSGNKV